MMGLLKHVLMLLLLESGAVLAFVGNDPAPDAGSGLSLCQSPVTAGPAATVTEESRSTRTPTEPVHENK